MRVGVILSGCGYLDGAEIQETVVTILCLENMGIELVFGSLDQPQSAVLNHQTNSEVIGQERNMLAEAARMTRGNVIDLHKISIDELSALVFPGGFGIAKNFSNFATQGNQMTVDPIVAKLMLDCYQQRKPLAGICIAPLLMANVLGEFGVTLTIGNDADIASICQKFGAKHQDCSADEYVIDTDHRVITTPAYMVAQSIKEIYPGIKKLTRQLKQMLSQ